MSNEKDTESTVVYLSMTYQKRLEEGEIITESVQAELIQGMINGQLRKALDSEDKPINIKFTINFLKEFNLEPIVFEMTWAQSKSICRRQS